MAEKEIKEETRNKSPLLSKMYVHDALEPPEHILQPERTDCELGVACTQASETPVFQCSHGISVGLKMDPTQSRIRDIDW